MQANDGIEVEDLVREFKNGPRAVDGIDLRVAPGEIYGFLGPNGAGKSTTVLMLTTLLPPTAGHGARGGPRLVARGPARARARSAPRCRRRRSTRCSPAASTCGCRRRSTASPQASARPRGDELLERVGLPDAADRKVGGYSGGMKRRLDLALALVHRPRMLFLDEPTTGLDPQSRRSCGRRSPASPARTASPSSSPRSTSRRPTSSPTASGSSIAGASSPRARPTALKAEIGRPTLEVAPTEPDDRDARRRGARAFGDRAAAPPGAARSGCAAAPRRSPTSSARSTPRASRPRPPAARAVARRRVPGQDRPQARGRGRRRAEAAARSASRRRRERARRRSQVGELARRSIVQTLRQPRSSSPPILFPLFCSRQRRRPGRRDAAPRLPDRLLPRLRARRAVHAGRAVRDDQRRHRARARRRDRVPAAPRADAAARPALLVGQLAGVIVVASLLSVRLPLRRLPRRASDVKAGLGGVARAAGAGDADRARLRALGALSALRAGSGEAVQGFFPLFFVLLFLSSMSLPRDLIEHDWFRTIATYNPVSYLIEGIRSPDDHRLGRRGAGARLRHRAR